MSAYNHNERTPSGAEYIRTGSSYLREISRGNIPGASLFGTFGRYVAGGPVNNKLIWPNGDLVIPGASGVTVDLVSANANDTLGGSGIGAVYCHYIKASNLSYAVKRVELNGGTVSNAITDFRFMQCMHFDPEQIGSAATGATGDITAQLNGGSNIYSEILAGELRCSSSAIFVPGGKRLFVAGAVVSSTSVNADAQAEFFLSATEIQGYKCTDLSLFVPHGGIGMQNNGIPYVFPAPIPFEEEVVVGLQGSVDKAATLNGDLFGWYEAA